MRAAIDPINQLCIIQLNNKEKKTTIHPKLNSPLNCYHISSFDRHIGIQPLRTARKNFPFRISNHYTYTSSLILPVKSSSTIPFSVVVHAVDTTQENIGETSSAKKNAGDLKTPYVGMFFEIMDEARNYYYVKNSWSVRDLISSKEANKGWSYRMKTIFKAQSPTESWVTFVLWIISISIDPLLCYLPVINDENKSVEINLKLVGLLGVVLFLLQSCGFAVKLAYFLASCSFVLQFLLVNAMIRADAAVFTIAVNSFLVLFSWRVYGVYGLLPYKVTSSYAEEAKTSMIKLVLNLVLYLYGGYVFGGIWYLFAIRKKTECWKKACRNHNGCHLDAIFGFIVSSGDTKFLNDNCPKILETNYAESYELGMFKDAFEFGIVESKNFPRKLLYCFKWGIQNLSGVGQSLLASSHAAENIFVIFIIAYGVVMFAYFLGNLQMYIKNATEASEKKRREEKEIIRNKKVMEIEKWVPFGNLSEKLQNCIKENQQYQRIVIVNVENLLENVSYDIKNNIKRELCLELLKKVGKFEKWSEASLFHLCDRLRPVAYGKGTRIVKEGDCLYDTWFVIQGKLWTFSKGCITADSTRKTDLLKAGDFWGEEFVNCIQNDPSSSTDLIISDRTIQALTEVDVFKLGNRVLKNLYNEKAKVIQSWFRKNRFRISRRNAQTSTQEQTLTGDHQLTAPEIVVIEC